MSSKGNKEDAELMDDSSSKQNPTKPADINVSSKNEDEEAADDEGLAEEEEVNDDPREVIKYVTAVQKDMENLARDTEKMVSLSSMFGESEETNQNSKKGSSVVSEVRMEEEFSKWKLQVEKLLKHVQISHKSYLKHFEKLREKMAALKKHTSLDKKTEAEKKDDQ